MTITTKSWIKDTSDLFDFEATNLSTKSYTVREKNTFVLVNDKDEVSFVDTEKDIDPISIVLGQVKNEDGYWVIPPLQSEFYGEVFCRNNIDRMWGIVKGNNSQEIILAQISAIYDKPPFVKVKTGQSWRMVNSRIRVFS